MRISNCSSTFPEYFLKLWLGSVSKCMKNIIMRDFFSADNQGNKYYILYWHFIAVYPIYRSVLYIVPFVCEGHNRVNFESTSLLYIRDQGIT